VARRHLSAHGVLTRYSRYLWGTHRHSWGTRRCPRPAGGSLFPPVAYLRAREARFPGQKLPVPAAFANSIVWDRFLSLCAVLSSNPKFVASRQAEDRACPLGWPAAIALLKSGGFQYRPLRSKVSRNVPDPPMECPSSRPLRRVIPYCSGKARAPSVCLLAAVLGGYVLRTRILVFFAAAQVAHTRILPSQVHRPS
jgi:hypothetical protein